MNTSDETELIGEKLNAVARVVFIVIACLEIFSGVVGNMFLLTVMYTRHLLNARKLYSFLIANLAMPNEVRVFGDLVLFASNAVNWLVSSVLSKVLYTDHEMPFIAAFTVLFGAHSLLVRSFHNLFVANLALADLVILAYWMTFFVLDLLLGYHPVADQVHCRINGFLIATCYVVHTLSLLSISLNRYLHVCRSRLYHRLFSFRSTLLSCALLWVMGVTIALPPLLGVGSYRYSAASHFCSFYRDDPNQYAKVLVILFSVLPMATVGYLNFAIFRYWRRFHFRHRTDKKRNKEEAFVRSLFVVFLLMLCSFFPFGTVIIVSSYVTVPSEVSIAANLVLFFNSAVNWIVYGAMNPSFKRRRRSLRMRCVHNFFLASLALADLVSLGYWMTFYVLDLCLGYHPVVNETHCRANGFIIGVVYLGKPAVSNSRGPQNLNASLSSQGPMTISSLRVNGLVERALDF
nr:hypothetical protein BaRGS_014423 [Batillaria attramentaria]